MRTNVVALTDTLNRFADMPFSALSSTEQELVLTDFRKLFQNFSDVKDEELKKTALFNHIESLSKSVEDEFDEELFSAHLKPFVEALHSEEQGRSYQALHSVVERFLNRSEPFYASEEKAMKYRKDHSAEEIKKHDTEIFQKAVQIYALDYFLSMYELLKKSSKGEQEAAIVKGAGKMPALREDTLADDMLAKVVYSLAGKDIRRKMIRDYYTYKQLFVPLDGKESLSFEEIKNCISGLKTYCLSVVDASMEYGITTFSQTLLDPYNGEISFEELKQKLSS